MSLRSSVELAVFLSSFGISSVLLLRMVYRHEHGLPISDLTFVAYFLAMGWMLAIFFIRISRDIKTLDEVSS